jgi:signal transduction histidine kinase
VFDLLPVGYVGGPARRYVRVAVLRRHEALIDGAVPVLVGAVIVVGEILHNGHGAGPAPVALALALAAAGVLWLRRRWPTLTLAVSGLLVAALLHVDRAAGTVAVLAPAVALYSLALTRGRRLQVLAGLAAVGAVLGADLLRSGRPGFLQTLAHALLVAIPLLAAEQVRNHRSYLSLLTERLKLAEQAREREAERQAGQERMRIARELHDIVAHTLTEINVQAGAAAERMDASEGRETLERIEQASHSAIAELRAILGVLRETESADAPLAPAPRVENIAELVDRARAAGLQVDLNIVGDPPARLADAVSLATYRIVQESLTNARRHAAGAAVSVQVAYDAARLSILVENGAGSGAGANGAGNGVGVKGMLERAIAVGGVLKAGPIHDGFRVAAELPYRLDA